MKIEKRVYKVFYKGGLYALPIVISVDVVRMKKVNVRLERKQ